MISDKEGICENTRLFICLITQGWIQSFLGARDKDCRGVRGYPPLKNLVLGNGISRIPKQSQRVITSLFFKGGET